MLILPTEDKRYYNFLSHPFMIEVLFLQTSSTLRDRYYYPYFIKEKLRLYNSKEAEIIRVSLSACKFCTLNHCIYYFFIINGSDSYSLLKSWFKQLKISLKIEVYHRIYWNLIIQLLLIHTHKKTHKCSLNAKCTDLFELCYCINFKEYIFQEPLNQNFTKNK